MQRLLRPILIWFAANLMQLHTVLDEMILGGQVIETSSEQIMTSVEEIARFFLLPSFSMSYMHAMSSSNSILPSLGTRLEKQSSTTSFIPKSISERFSG
jgi:AP-3 complex subunit sigma